MKRYKHCEVRDGLISKPIKAAEATGLLVNHGMKFEVARFALALRDFKDTV
jgi:hypothetical protein